MLMLMWVYMLQLLDMQQQLLIVGLVCLDHLSQPPVLILQSRHLLTQVLHLHSHRQSRATLLWQS